jgi:hypothetical protein
MNLLKKALTTLASQIRKPDVKLASVESPNKIKDDNQSIHNGVIHEKFDTGLRSEGNTITKRKRSTKPKRTP